MKKIFFFAFLLMQQFTWASTIEEFLVQGQITDKQTGQKLVGATIYFSDLKLGTITNKEGFYKINLPKGSHVAEISFMGYATQVSTLTIEKPSTFNFVLQPTVIEAGDVREHPHQLLLLRKKNYSVVRQLI